MKVFTCTDHAGVWPVGVASVVIADTADEATRLLISALTERGLDTRAFTLQEVDLAQPVAIILHDGDY